MQLVDMPMKYTKYNKYPGIKKEIKKFVGNKAYLSIFSLCVTLLIICITGILTAIIYEYLNNNERILFSILCSLAVIFPMCSFFGNAFVYSNIISSIKKHGFEYIVVDVHGVTAPAWRKGYRPDKNKKTPHTWLNSVTYLFNFELEDNTIIKLCGKDAIIGNYDVNDMDEATIIKIKKKIYILQLEEILKKGRK